MKKFPILFVCLVMAYVTDAREKTFTVTSPDMANEVTVSRNDAGFTMQINHDGKTVCHIEDISMTVSGVCWNGESDFRKAIRQSVDRDLHPVVARKFSVLKDCCRQRRYHRQRIGRIRLRPRLPVVYTAYRQGAELVRVPLYGAARIFPAA